MNPAHTCPSSAGRHFGAIPQPITVPMTPGEKAHAFAAVLDRRADLLLAFGQRAPAERLAFRAAALRESAR